MVNDIMELNQYELHDQYDMADAIMKKVHVKYEILLRKIDSKAFSGCLAIKKRV